jgi:hypothetical protein
VNQNLGALVLSIVTHFDHIIEVIINKGSRYRARVHEASEFQVYASLLDFLR